jgi:hypothetical protein
MLPKFLSQGHIEAGPLGQQVTAAAWVARFGDGEGIGVALFGPLVYEVESPQKLVLDLCNSKTIQCSLPKPNSTFCVGAFSLHAHAWLCTLFYHVAYRGPARPWVAQWKFATYRAGLGFVQQTASMRFHFSERSCLWHIGTSGSGRMVWKTPRAGICRSIGSCGGGSPHNVRVLVYLWG